MRSVPTELHQKRFTTGPFTFLNQQNLEIVLGKYVSSCTTRDSATYNDAIKFFPLPYALSLLAFILFNSLN